MRFYLSENQQALVNKLKLSLQKRPLPFFLISPSSSHITNLLPSNSLSRSQKSPRHNFP